MISVCLASYNGERFISEQISSILCQLGNTDELVISDDGSKDNTINIIQSYDDERIKLCFNKGPHSPIFNFENALRYCSGDIIFLSDQDDVWEENKVVKCLDILNYADLVLHDASIIDSNGNLLDESIFSKRKSCIGLFPNLLQNSYMGCCIAFRANLLKQILPFPRNTPMHDVWIGLITEIFGRTILSTDKLIKYRRHESNVTVSISKSNFSIWKKISFRISLVVNLMKRIVKSYGI